jgi:hypothetical protein
MSEIENSWFNALEHSYPQRPASHVRTNMNRKIRTAAEYGGNIKFIATYLFLNPGSPSRDVRMALCEERGIEWEGTTRMRGQYTSYFTTGWIGGRSWPKNPCGRYWRRMSRPDGKNGYMLTVEGIGKVGLYEEEEEP